MSTTATATALKLNLVLAVSLPSSDYSWLTSRVAAPLLLSSLFLSLKTPRSGGWSCILYGYGVILYSYGYGIWGLRPQIQGATECTLTLGKLTSNQRRTQSPTELLLGSDSGTKELAGSKEESSSPSAQIYLYSIKAGRGHPIKKPDKGMHKGDMRRRAKPFGRLGVPKCRAGPDRRVAKLSSSKCTS
ncbi:hypothetical protein B0H13DRAFT_1936329 [Mycena leptocephala]|nr:hypothetical protein B0H13DRAFT_1936329 [Mycena leptocephala]